MLTASLTVAGSRVRSAVRHHPQNVTRAREQIRVAIVYRNFAGHSATSHVGLGVTALNVQRVLRGRGIACDVWSCWTAQDVATRLADAQEDAYRRGRHPVSHVVISAPWVGTDEIRRLIAAHDDVDFVVVSHSNFGFLAADPGAIRLLREQSVVAQGAHNFRIGGNNARFTDAWRRMYASPCLHLPNLYDVSGMAHVGHRMPWRAGEPLRLGIFGATRPLKNMITAVAAAVQLGADLRAKVEIFMNSGRDDGSGGGVVDSAIRQLVEGLPTVSLVRMGWRAWPDFRHDAGSMHLLFQPSYTESFNGVTADGIAAGVASVVSDAIDWVPPSWVARADDVEDVARVARALLHDPHAVDAGQAALRRHVDHGARVWESYLTTGAAA